MRKSIPVEVDGVCFQKNSTFMASHSSIVIDPDGTQNLAEALFISCRHAMRTQVCHGGWVGDEKQVTVFVG
jgi:hypothetical protein